MAHSKRSKKWKRNKVLQSVSQFSRIDKLIQAMKDLQRGK